MDDPIDEELIPKFDDYENKALDDASLDMALGIKHMDISEDVKNENANTADPLVKLYLGEESGYTRKQGLKTRAGIGQDDSWTDYIANGGQAPAGYEIESKLALAEEKRNKLFNQYENGDLSESDFLYQAYGKDYMKASHGDDLSSVSYWYNKFSNGDYSNPLDNPVYLQDVLDHSKALFQADEAIAGLYKPKAHYQDGQVVDEKTFAEMYNFTDEYVEALGGYSEMISKYKAGFLGINPFIDANKDGKITDGDYYYHDDGRVYQLGKGAKIKSTDAYGKPKVVEVGSVDGWDHIKTLTVGVFDGFIGGLVESVCTLGSLVIDIFAPGELNVTKEFQTKLNSWKNGLRIGNTALYNDDMWVAPDAGNWADADVALNQISSATGNIAGMILMALATAGVGNAAKAGSVAITKAGSATVAETLKAGGKVTLKEGIKAATKALGTTATKGQKFVQGSKYLGLRALSGMSRGFGAVTNFNQGIVRSSAKTGADFATREALKGAKGFFKGFTASGLTDDLISSAILTSKDFVDNIARSAAINDCLVDENGNHMEGWRSTGQIIGDAAGVAAVNYVITSTLRATWDDVGLTGRFGKTLQTLQTKQVPGSSSKLANWLIKRTNSTSRLNALIDTFSDTAEMALTMTNNQFVQSGGFSKLTGEDWGKTFTNFITSPAGITSMLYSSVSTYNGAFGKNNFGAVHRGGNELAINSKNLTDKLLTVVYKKIEQVEAEIQAKPQVDKDGNPVQDTRIDTLKGLAEEIKDRQFDPKKIFFDEDGNPVFGITFKGDGSDPEINKSGKIVYEKGSTIEAKDGELVFSLNPGKGELSLNDMPQSLMSLANIARLKNDFGESSGFIDEAVHAMLDEINTDVMLKRYSQVAAMLAVVKQYNKAFSKLDSDDAAVDAFLENLKNDKLVNRAKKLMHRFSKTKWASIADANDMDETLEIWRHLVENPNMLFTIEDARDSETIKKNRLAVKNKVEKYFIEGNVVDLAEILVKNGAKKFKNKDINITADETVKGQISAKEIVEVLNTISAKYGIPPERLMGLSFKKLKKASDFGEAANDNKQMIDDMRKECDLLSRLTDEYKGFGAEKFFVFSIERTEGDKKMVDYYFAVQPDAEADISTRNHIHANFALQNIEALGHGDLGEKKAALVNLIKVLSADGGNDPDLLQTRAKVIIESALDSGVISAHEALLLSKKYFKNSSDGVLKNTAEKNGNNSSLKYIIAVNEEIEKLSKCFDSVTTIGKDPNKGKGSKEYETALDNFNKQAETVESMLKNNHNNGILLDQDNNIVNSTKFVVSDTGGLIGKDQYERIIKKDTINFTLSRENESDSAIINRTRSVIRKAKAVALVKKMMFEGMHIKDISSNVKYSIKKFDTKVRIQDTAVKFLEFVTEFEDNINTHAAANYYYELKQDLRDELTVYQIDQNTGAKTDITPQAVKDFLDVTDELIDAVINKSSSRSFGSIVADFITRYEDQIGSITEKDNWKYGKPNQTLNKLLEAYGIKSSKNQKTIESLLRSIPTEENLNRMLKKKLLVEVRKKNSVFSDSLETREPGRLESMVEDTNISYDDFSKELYNLASRKNLIDWLSDGVVEMSKAYQGTTSVKKNRRLVINLAELKTAQEQSVIDQNFYALLTPSARKSDKSIIQEMAKANGGVAAIVSASSALSSALVSHKGDAYLVFDLDNQRDYDTAKNFFKSIGYEDANEGNFNDIEGVTYKPNSDTGFEIVSEFDVLQNAKALKLSSIITDGGTIRFSAKQRIFNLALNQVAISKDSPMNLETMNMVLAYIASPEMALSTRGEMEYTIDLMLKMGKAASGSADLISRIVNGIRSIKGGETTKQYTSMQTFYSIRQAMEVCNSFFDMRSSLEQGTHRIPLEKADTKDRRTKLGKIFEITKEADGTEYITGFKKDIDIQTASEEAYKILRAGGTVFDILPITYKAYTKLYNKSVSPDGINIFGFGKHLIVDQKDYSVYFDNYLVSQLDTLRGSGFDSLNRLASFNNSNRSRKSLVPTDFTFNNKDIKDCATFGKLKETVDKLLQDDNNKNDFYLLQLQTQLIGLELLSEQESKFKFLADPLIRRTIIENIDKDANEILRIIRNLKYEEPTTKQDGTIKVKDMFNLEFKEQGYSMSNPYINSEAGRTLGIQTDKKTFKELKEMITADIINELKIDSIKMTNAFKNIYKVDEMSDAEIIENKVNSILVRTRYEDADGNISYHLTVDDIADLDEKELKYLNSVLGTSSKEKAALNNTWKHLNVLIEDAIADFTQGNDTETHISAAVPVGKNIRGVSQPIPPVTTNKAEVEEGLDIGFHRANELAHRGLRNFARKKMSSLHSTYNDSFGLQAGADKYMSDNSIITNEGNRTTYDFNNKYLASKYFYSCAYLEENLREFFAQKKMQMSDDKVLELAMKMVASTTGVEVSDGYEGTFIIEEDGTVTSSIRTNNYRSNDSTDTLLNYFKLVSEKRKPKFMFVLDKNAGVESGDIRVLDFEENKDLDFKFREAFYMETAYKRAAGESSQDYWMRKIPRARINRMLADNLVKELGLPASYAKAFRNTAISIAAGFSDDYASITYEGFVNYLMDQVHSVPGYETLTREQFYKIKNKTTQDVNDIVKYAVAEDHMPEGLKQSLRNFAYDIGDDRALRYEAALREGRAFKHDDINVDDLTLAHILSARDGMHKAFVIRALLNKDLDSTEGLIDAIKEDEDGNQVVGAYTKWSDIKNNGKTFLCFDTEWIFDLDQNKYLSQIALKAYKIVNGNLVAVPVKGTNDLVITFDTKQHKLDAKSEANYREKMREKFKNESDTTPEEIEKYLDKQLSSNNAVIIKDKKGNIVEVSHTEQELQDIIKAFVKDSGAKYFLSYNGKGHNSDINTLGSQYSPIKFLVNGKSPIITESNHIDGFLDMVRILRPTVPEDLGIDYDDATNLSLYNVINEYRKKVDPNYQSTIDTTDVHNAITDLQMTAEVISFLFKETPRALQSQAGEFYDEIKSFLIKSKLVKETDPHLDDWMDQAGEWHDGIVTTAIKEAKKKIYENRGEIYLSKEDKAFMDSVSDYKTLSNEGFRKAMNTMNAYRKSLDLKAKNYLTDDILQAMFGDRVKPLLDSLMNNYEEGQKILFYLTCKESGKGNIEIAKRFEVAEDILAEMFGDQSEYTSNLKSFEYFDELLRSGRVDEFFEKLNRSDRLNEKGFSSEDLRNHNYGIEKAQEVFDNMKKKDIESMEVGSDLYKSYLTLTEDTSRVEKNSYMMKLKNAITSIIDVSSKFGKMEFDKDNSFWNVVFDNILDEFTRPIDNTINTDLYQEIYSDNPTVRNSARAQLKRLYREPAFLDTIREIIKENRRFIRSYSKSSVIRVGTVVKDINGNDVTVTNGDAVITASLFKQIFGADYADVISEYKGGNIYAPILRHPSDKTDTINPFKLIVVKDSDVRDSTVRVCPITNYSLMAGDFDGDSVMIFRPSVKESVYYGKINKQQFAPYSPLGRIYKEAEDYAQTIFKNKKGLKDPYLIAINSFNNSKDLRAKMLELNKKCLQAYIDSKGIGFKRIYDDVKAEAIKLLKDNHYKDDVIDMIMPLYFLREKEIGADQSLFLTYDNYTYRNLTPEQRELMDDMTNKYIHASASMKGSQNEIASDTGSVQRYMLFEDQDTPFFLTDNLRYRPFTLDGDQEIVLRLYFASSKHQQKIKDILKETAAESKDKTLKDLFNSLKNKTITFNDFRYFLTIAEERTQKKLNAWTKRNLNGIDAEQKDYKIKNEARMLAANVYKKVEDMMPVRTNRDDFALNNKMAELIIARHFNDIRNDENKIKAIHPRSFAEGWVLYLPQPKSASQKSIQGDGKAVGASSIESIFLNDAFFEGKGIFRNLEVKVPGGTDYEVGETIKAGTTIGGKTLPYDYTVYKKDSRSGRLFLSSEVNNEEINISGLEAAKKDDEFKAGDIVGGVKLTWDAVVKTVNKKKGKIILRSKTTNFIEYTLPYDKTYKAGDPIKAGTIINGQKIKNPSYVESVNQFKGTMHIKSKKPAHFEKEVPNVLKVKEGDVIREGETIAGQTMHQDVKVIKIDKKKGTAVLKTTTPLIAKGTKLHDPDHEGTKVLVSTPNEDERIFIDGLKQDLIGQKTADGSVIQDNNIIGFSYQSPNIKKFLNSPGPGEVIKLKNGAYAVYQPFATVEDSDSVGGGFVKESGFDYLSILGNTGTATGIVTLGDEFVRKDSNGNWIVDPRLANMMKHVEENMKSKSLGKRDGRPVYYTLTILSLLDLAGDRIPEEKLNNYAKLITHKDIIANNGENIILELLNNYFYNKENGTIDVGSIINKKIEDLNKDIELQITNVKESAEVIEKNKEKLNHLLAMKALLSSSLFEKVFGTYQSGIREDGTFGPIFTKSSADVVAKAESSDQYIGKNNTTQRKDLIDTGRYSDQNFVSITEIINTISNAIGGGIVTDIDSIMFNRPVHTDLNDRAKGSTQYSYSGKYGTGAVSKTTDVGEYGIGDETFDWDPSYKDLPTEYQAFKLGDRFGRKGSFYYNDKEPKYDPMNKNNSLWMASSKALKMRKLLDFFMGTKETAYDRASNIDRGVKESASVVLPMTKYEPHTKEIVDAQGNKRIVYTTMNPYSKDIESIDGKTEYTASELYDIRHDEEHRKAYKNPTVAALYSNNDLGGPMNKALASKDFKDRLESFLEFDKTQFGERANDMQKAFDEIKHGRRVALNEVTGAAPTPVKIVMSDTIRYDNIGNAADKNFLTDSGMKFKANEEGVAATEAWAETRYDKATLDLPKEVGDEIKAAENRTLDIDMELKCIQWMLDRTNGNSAGFNKYITLKGIVSHYDAIGLGKQDPKSDSFKTSQTRVLESLKELGFDDIDKAKEFVDTYEKTHSLLVNTALKLVDNLDSIVNDINKYTGNYVQPYYLLLMQKAEESKDKGEVRKSNKRRMAGVLNKMFTVTSNIKGAYTVKDYFNLDKSVLATGGYVDFMGNMKSLSESLIKTQTIMRCADKLPKDNYSIKNIVNGIFNEHFAMQEDGTVLNQEIGKNSNFSKRSEMFSIIEYRLNTKLSVTNNASEDYVTSINRVKGILGDYLKTLGLRPDTTYESLEVFCNNNQQNKTAQLALSAYESLYELYHGALVTSPSLKKSIVEVLSDVVSRGNVALVDRLGRRISPKGSSDISSLIRKPISEIDMTYIRDAIIDCPGDINDYETKLAIRALTGDVYVMDALVTKKLEERFFTKKVPSPVMKAIQKSSRWCAKMLMSQPLKLIRRLMQFSLYDFNMAMTANPNTVKYMNKARKELSAFYQSKGASCTDDLRDYLKHQGFDYKDIKGYDPVQMETTDDHSMMDRAYFDKVNSLFSMQNLFVRYALYQAELEGFSKQDTGYIPYYGVMYNQKDRIDKLSDNGLKAMEVIDATLGGPKGFSEAARKLGQYGFVFTTFPLAIARWGTEGAATVKSLFTQEGGVQLGAMFKHLGAPLMTMGATFGILYGIITALCNMFGLDEEDAEEMARNQEFIDPINTILSDGIVKVSDNSVFQLQALIDSFDSFKEEEKWGGKILGFVNDNFLSHFNPILKSTAETMFGGELIGGDFKKNDFTLKENAERKLLGYLIGSSGANAYVKEGKEPNSSRSTKIGAAIAAEIGNTKAFKSDKRSYQKSLKYVNSFLKDAYEGKDNYIPGTDLEHITSLASDLKKGMEDGKDLTYLIAKIEEAAKEGYTDKEVKASIKSISIIGKLNKISDLELSDSFFENMTQETKHQILAAIRYEQRYFPYLDDLVEEFNLEDKDDYKNHIYIKKNYNRAPFHRTYSPRINYVKPVYNGHAYSKNKNRIPDIKDLYIYRLTNTTGKKAVDIGDLIGSYYQNYYNDYSGNLEGERYQERKNRRQTQSDWRN